MLARRMREFRISHGFALSWNDGGLCMSGQMTLLERTRGGQTMSLAVRLCRPLAPTLLCFFDIAKIDSAAHLPSCVADRTWRKIG